MTIHNLEDDLTAISDNALQPSPDFPSDHSAITQELISQVSAKGQEQRQLRKTLKELRLIVLSLPEKNHSVAWRCTHVFHHQNNRVCNTVNGFQKNGNSVRRLCQKCQQKRTNPKTVIEEYLEMEKESIKENLIQSGLSEAEAERQIELVIKGE